MNHHFLQSFTTFFVVLVASHASVDPEVYFKYVLPNTPMPKAIKDRLPCGECEENASYVMANPTLNNPSYVRYKGDGSDAIIATKMTSVSKLNNPPYNKYNDDASNAIINPLYKKYNDDASGSNINPPYKKYSDTASDSIVNPPYKKYNDDASDAIINPPYKKYSDAASDSIVNPLYKKYSDVASDSNVNPPYKKYINVASDSIVNPSYKKYSDDESDAIINPPYKKYNDDASSAIVIPLIPLYKYKDAASDATIMAMKMSSLYFFEKDIRAGKSMKLHISKDATTTTRFVPRQVADSLPFTSNKLDDIYNKFKVNPDSLQANLIKKTFNDCEKAFNQEQDEYCATFLESMVDFATSKVGKKVQVISTQVNGKENAPLHPYKVKDVTKLNQHDVVVCHREFYGYAIHYCHKASKINAYMVTLIGENNVRAKAISICHEDTASWNPKHIAFQVLNVKPETNSVCHFLIENDVAWIPY